MSPIVIGRKRLSNFVWGIIDEKAGHIQENLHVLIAQQNELREKADYKTGSIGIEDVVEVYKATKAFNPKIIAEVGTFIGTSTLTMMIAAKDATIYTCDMSNDIDLGQPNIIQYPKKTSHEMFADMAEKGLKVDLVYLDGRLTQADVEPLNKIVHEGTVFLMDDFEGVEKGVANAMFLESPNRVLIYPRERKKTAISIPFGSMLQVLPQEPT